MKAQIEKMIRDVADDFIRPYNPTVATMFINQPFNRRNLAIAFEAGFKTAPDFCKTIMKVVELDIEMRALLAKHQ